MKGTLLCIAAALLTLVGMAQTVTTNPVFPAADQPVTITVDVAGTSLALHAWNDDTDPVYLWAWIDDGCSSACDAPTNVNPATAAQALAKVTRINTNPVTYQITITPTTFFNKPASQIKRMGFKLKTRDWADNKQTDNDRFITFSTADLAVQFTAPTPGTRLFVNPGTQLPIKAVASAASDLTLKVDGSTVASSPGALSLNYVHTVSVIPRVSNVVVTATRGAETKEASFQYVVRAPIINAARPTGIVDGINYNGNATSVTLSLWAPGKTSVYVRGDFNNWQIDPDYQLMKDGEHFWITLTGLTAGQEYAFQYLVDETLWMADPYADKILDPADQGIPASVYPNLKAYPQAARSDKDYFNRVAVFQTAQTAYTWQVSDYQRPKKEELVIYEVLIRDFFDDAHRSYQSLVDTLGYFRRLGVNAIQLMPIMEFTGNDSWGYNPTFMFAPDKYYGPKDQFKAFVDACHEQGIAVILDIAMNHQDITNPYVLMDFDFAAGKPTANNKWFNITATHPFSVFYDMNHESPYTKTYLDTVNYYWLKEYKIDGYRFDLSKGFTQRNNPDDVSAWSAYDASRIAILKRMADKIWSHFPDAYVILEHLAANDEEKELAEYRANEGKGMMLWGNLNYNYSQNAMGYLEGTPVGWGYYGNRGWSVPHAVTYMESHDEERMMYRNQQFGNASGSYNIKTLHTALERIKPAAAFLFAQPGPKMLWQFGEMGYDVSIDENGRTGAKPVRWSYLLENDRRRLWNIFASLFDLRKTYDVFRTGMATIINDDVQAKQLTIRNNPYTATPASADEMNVHIIANFDVVARTVSAAFPHAGKWYHYYSPADSLQAATVPVSVILQPGEFRLYTDIKITANYTPEQTDYERPMAPVLTNVAENTGSVGVTWQDRSTIETQYKIYRATAAGAFTSIGNAARNATTYQDKNSNLIPFTTYHYFVEAVNAVGVSHSDTVSITTTAIVTSLEEERFGSLSIYPNPTRGTVTLHTPNVRVASVRIVDARGQAHPAKLEGEELNMSQLPAGVYIVHITNAQGASVTRKLVKL
jgi:1,4-alpha-glucan branching enzyme